MSEGEKYVPVIEGQLGGSEIVSLTTQAGSEMSAVDPISIFVAEARANRTDLRSEPEISLADQFAIARKVRYDLLAGHPRQQIAPSRTVEEKLADIFDPNNAELNKTVEAFAAAREARHDSWSKVK